MTEFKIGDRVRVRESAVVAYVKRFQAVINRGRVGTVHGTLTSANTICIRYDRCGRRPAGHQWIAPRDLELAP